MKSRGNYATDGNDEAAYQSWKVEYIRKVTITLKQYYPGFTILIHEF